MRWSIPIIIGIALAFALGFLAGRTSEISHRVLPQSLTTAGEISGNAASSTQDVESWYRVIKVIDGDTLVVAIKGQSTTIRLIGLDTPETIDPRKPVQCFGKEASEKAKQILSGSEVRLETDPSQGERDKYGRTLAYIFLKDGTNFNHFMIAEGYGHEYTYNLPYKYQEEFKAAERAAREQKRGLWADNARSTLPDASTNTARPGLAVPSARYECSRNVYNCADFKTQAEAQAAFDACGGSANDIHKLDADGDGKVCESLP